jgi:uncharacterized protein
MVVEAGVSVPMRDGVILRADVYRPDDAGPAPALLLRTCYDRSVPMVPLSGIDVDAATAAGYAVVCQDVRGTYGSDGAFYPFLAEAADGYDTVEWVAEQPWCDGGVGMIGRSYAATCQWLAASQRPPHLRAICPVVTGSDFFRGWVYQGGAFQLGFNLFWVWMMSKRGRGSPKPEQLFTHLPLKTVELPDPEWGSFYFDWLEHSRDDEYWSSLSVNRRYRDIDVPALVVGGWFDVFLGGTLENFVRLPVESGSERAQAGTRLLVGAWAHGSTYGLFPDHSFGLYERNDGIDFADVQLAFFDRHVRADGGADAEPRVRLFVMGRNEWRDEDAWPLARAREEAWHLRTGGRLSVEPPGAEEPDVYAYDPADPAPTVGGPTSLPPRVMRTNSGPLDQTSVEERDDVLVYTSAPFPEPAEIVGDLCARLHVATDAVDTDFTAALVDVFPDGACNLIQDGIQRMSLREPELGRRLLEPGRVEEVEIDLWATAYRLGAVHRLRVEVSSSEFDRYDRNLNTAELPHEGTETVIARQSVFHDASRPSHVLVPLRPVSASDG